MLIPSHCDRCGGPMPVAKLSLFNLDWLCTLCFGDEQLAPNWQAAHDAELRETQAGNLNFEGIGLAPEDRTFLEARRKSRRLDDAYKIPTERREP